MRIEKSSIWGILRLALECSHKRPFSRGTSCPRRLILSAAERESLLALPDNRDDLIRRYTLSESDLSIIRQRRGPSLATARTSIPRFSNTSRHSGGNTSISPATTNGMASAPHKVGSEPSATRIALSVLHCPFSHVAPICSADTPSPCRTQSHGENSGPCGIRPPPQSTNR
jgi:hypothetical protein